MATRPKGSVARVVAEQDGECCYCGKKIRGWQKIARAFDNHGIAHLKCASLGRLWDA